MWWKTIACLAVLGAALGAPMLRGVSAQDTTPTPGQPTQARVWIENRDRADAVPVSIETIAPDVPPLRVELGQRALVNARAARQQWEYRVLAVAAGTDPTAALNMAGQEGWEAAGVSPGAGQGINIILKRPR